MSGHGAFLLPVRAILAGALFAAVGAGPVQGQQTCAEIDAVRLACLNPADIEGTPPDCTCQGARIDDLELTCAANYGCPDAGVTATGHWPECACPAGEAPGSSGPPVVDGPGPTSFLGGIEVCRQFFECTGDGHLALIGGVCVCLDAWLPQSRD